MQGEGWQGMDEQQGSARDDMCPPEACLIESYMYMEIQVPILLTTELTLHPWTESYVRVACKRPTRRPDISCERRAGHVVVA